MECCDYPVDRARNKLSGRYNFFPLGTNENVFRKEGSTLKLDGENFFLVHKNGFWFITNEKYALDQNITCNQFAGFFRLKTTGLNRKTHFEF